MRRMLICCAAIALLTSILLVVRPWRTPVETAVPAPEGDRSRPLPADHEGLMALGVAQRRAGEYGDAEVSLRKCLELSPKDPARRERIQLELALALMKQDRARDAVVELVKLLLENPYSRRAYVQLGQCLSRMARVEAADRFFEVAQTLSRGDAEARRAAELLAAGHPELAARYRARSFALSGQFEEAERVFRESSLTRSPGLRIYFAEYLLDTLQARRARGVLEVLVPALGRSHPDLRGWTAMALKHEGRADEAAGILAVLCREQPELTAVWAPELARILLDDLARPGEALRWLELYLEDHENVEARILLARALLGTGEVEDAAEVLRSTPSEGYAWEEAAGDVWLALCRVRLGEDPRAVAEFLSAIAERYRHLPEYHLAMAEWAAANAEAVSPDPGEEARRLSSLKAEFVALCQRAATADEPHVAPQLSSAAEVLWRMGDRDGAIRFARIAASVAPGESRAWALLEAWLDRPEDVFFRAEARRRLAPGAPEMSPTILHDIVASLMGRDR